MKEKIEISWSSKDAFLLNCHSSEREIMNEED